MGMLNTKRDSRNNKEYVIKMLNNKENIVKRNSEYDKTGKRSKRIRMKGPMNLRKNKHVKYYALMGMD